MAKRQSVQGSHKASDANIDRDKASQRNREDAIRAKGTDAFKSGGYGENKSHSDRNDIEQRHNRMSANDRVPGTYKLGNYNEKMVRDDREMDIDWRKNESVPGTRKNNASFEEQTLRNVRTPDIALNDARVRDMEYDYTTRAWPGKMQPDRNLDRGEVMQIRHRPQIDADTTK